MLRSLCEMNSERLAFPAMCWACQASESIVRSNHSYSSGSMASLSDHHLAFCNLIQFFAICIYLCFGIAGEALDCLVSIQTKLEKDDTELLEHLKRVLAIQERKFGHESEEVMMTLEKVIFFLDKLGMRDEKFPLRRRLSLLRTKYENMVRY